MAKDLGAFALTNELNRHPHPDLNPQVSIFNLMQCRLPRMKSQKVQGMLSRWKPGAGILLATGFVPESIMMKTGAEMNMTGLTRAGCKHPLLTPCNLNFMGLLGALKELASLFEIGVKGLG